jgi:hypothetical protein
MNKNIGLWIDHRKAVIVIIGDEGEQVKEITSHMGKACPILGRRIRR